MGYIKEPEGVDFIIQGEPLTDEQKSAISGFIKADKERLSKPAARLTKRAGRRRNCSKSEA